MSLQYIVGERQIRRGTRERADVIKVVDEGKAAGARQPAESGLQTEYAAERRGHSD